MTLATLATLILLVALGVWQLQRLQWKRDLLARMAATQAAPAAPLEDALQRLRNGEDVEHLRVVGDCPGLDQAPYVRLSVIFERVAGFRAISACRIVGGPYDAVLVDRGFVAEADAVRLAGGRPALHRAVVGVLRAPERPSFVVQKNRPAENAWFSRDPEAMGRALGADAAAPLLLFLESPPPAGFGPTPAPPPVQVSNNHLGYAVTWFGLAAALLGVYAAYVLRGRRT